MFVQLIVLWINVLLINMLLILLKFLINQLVVARKEGNPEVISSRGEESLSKTIRNISLSCTIASN